MARLGLGLGFGLLRGVVVVLVVCVGVVGVVCGPVWGAQGGPGWQVVGRFGPTDIAPGGEDVLFLYVYNVGGAVNAGEGPRVLVVLPEGVVAAGGAGGCSGSGTSEVVCEPGAIQPGGDPVELVIPVEVGVGASVSPVAVTASGGGALETTHAEVPVVLSSAPAGLGFAGFGGWLSNADGTIDRQAGSHPYEFTTTFAVNSEGVGGSHEESPTVGEAQALNINLPPGMVGEPDATPRCTRAAFDSENGCPGSTEIGEDRPSVNGGVLPHLSIYNLVPPKGVAAQFGFIYNGTSVFLDAGVRSGGDNGITEHIDPVPQKAVVFNSTTIWGTPGEHAAANETQKEREADTGLKPLLTMPTSCGEKLTVGLEELGTWSQPTVHREDTFELPEMTGCEKLVHFQPSLSVAPDTTYADSPAGLSAALRVPQGLNGASLAVSSLRDTTVTLPVGVAINPGQANGLQACQASDEAMGLAANGEVNEEAPSCPAASKVGTDEITTPLLPDKLEGSVYVLQSNPPELKLLVAASGDGINLKFVGTVHLNEATGQLTTTFENTPDAPFSEFVLSFNGGPQAALVTPTGCGPYETMGVLTPWSAPFTSEAFSLSRFAIDSGPDGAPCVSPLPFAPSMTAGSTSDQAGGYTSFSMLLTRGDEQQRVAGLQFKAPAGLAGMISKVPLCAGAQAAAGECAQSSQIGHTVVGSGPGPDPLFIPQPGGPEAPVYLTEGYEGAPFGLLIKVPVDAGPFELGVVLVRGRIEVDPHTAQITITTGSLPSIVKGIPDDLRWIYAVIDRPGFMFNPTSCQPMSFTGTATSTEGATAALSSAFRVGSCQSLKFKPEFKASTSGRPSRADGASLDVRIVYPALPPGTGQASSQANIARVKVELPARLPSRLTTLQQACKAAVFAANPAGCPAGSVVGHATVHTPILNQPLTGPAYFVSHGGEAFPSLIMVLQGQGITVDLEGTTFISSKGITTSTFKTVPDVPFNSFELVLPQGPHSALAANGSLCKSKLLLPTEFLAQNGALITQNTKIAATGCPKQKNPGKTRTNSKNKSSKKSKGSGSGGRRR